MKVVKTLSVAIISSSKSGSAGNPFYISIFFISWLMLSHTRTIGTDNEISRHSVNIASFKSFLVMKSFSLLAMASVVNYVRGIILIRVPFSYVLMYTLWHSYIYEPVKAIVYWALLRTFWISPSLYFFSNKIESNSSMMNVVLKGSNFYFDTIDPDRSSNVQ